MFLLQLDWLLGLLCHLLGEFFVNNLKRKGALELEILQAITKTTIFPSSYTVYLVGMGVVDDGLGPGGKFQRGLGLVFFKGGGGAHDGRLGVASQAVLEDPCQLGDFLFEDMGPLSLLVPAFGQCLRLFL